MATLQKIRNRSTIMLLAIGIALVGFVLTDALTNGSALLNFNKNYVVKVDNTKLSLPEFEAKVDEIQQSQGPGSDSYQVREAAWSQTLQEMIFQNQYNKLGIGVSGEEVLDMYAGKFISPVVRRQFTNPKTGEFNVNDVKQNLKVINLSENQIPVAQRGQWAQLKSAFLYLEDGMVAERKESKYTSLLTQAMYTSNLEVALNEKENDFSYDFEYVYVPYSSIKNSEVVLNELDIESYYKKHKERFETKASREVEYVSFPLVPSSEDHRKVKEDVLSMAKDFGTATDDNDFIALNSENRTPIVYKSQEDIAPELKDQAFSATVGTVFTPTFENATNTWTIIKLHDKKMLSDSVKVSLIQIAPAKGDVQETFEARVDSIYQLAKNAKDFNSLKEVSAYKSPTGDLNLGWRKLGQGIDSCFDGKVGDVFIYHSSNSVAIVKVTEQSKRVEKVGLATVTKVVNYSPETQRATYDVAAKFLAKVNNQAQFDTLAAKENIYKRTVSVHENDYQLEGLGNCRETIKWVNKADKGDVSSVQEIDDKLVIACVSNIINKGYAPLESVKSAIKLALLKEKRTELCEKQISEALKGASDMGAVASKLKVSVDRVSNLLATSPIVNSIGSEPSLITAAAFAQENKVVGPIDGNAGVFAIQVTKKTAQKNMLANAGQTRMRNDLIRRYTLNQMLYNELEKKTEVVDNRSRFY